jgi:HlyD family secretion protein
LDPKNHLDKMDIPEIEEVDDREQLAKIAADAPKMAARSADGKAPGGRGQGGGGPSAGGQGGGAPNPETIATAMLGRLDANSDGKVTKEEASSDERMSGAFAEYDTNKDGSVDKGEILTSLQKRFQGGGGQGGGGAGRPSEGMRGEGMRGGPGGGSSRGAPSN